MNLGKIDNDAIGFAFGLLILAIFVGLFVVALLIYPFFMGGSAVGTKLSNVPYPPAIASDVMGYQDISGTVYGVPVSNPSPDPSKMGLVTSRSGSSSSRRDPKGHLQSICERPASGSPRMVKSKNFHGMITDHSSSHRGRSVENQAPTMMISLTRTRSSPSSSTRVPPSGPARRSVLMSVWGASGLLRSI